MYIAADQVLPSVKLQDCPAEYLNSIMMKSIRTRGCGLGYLVYGGRTTERDENGEKTIFKNPLSIDSLRLAVPRNQYESEKMIAFLSVIGEAFKNGDFKNLSGGLKPLDYVDNGFYHFGGNYEYIDKFEF